MEIRELHEIATMYTNIAEALSFANEFKPKGTTITLEEIKVNADSGAKAVEICLLYEYKDFEREEIFDFDVDYMRSTMVNDICTDVARFVKECEECEGCNEFENFRAETGLTVREFADTFKIPLRTVQDWNSGKRACKPYILDLLREKWRNLSK